MRARAEPADRRVGGRRRGALVVDAVASGAAPGTVHRFDASERAVPARVFRSSTHAFGVGEAIELARALGRLPGRASSSTASRAAEFAAGEGLTPPVEAAVERAATAVLEDELAERRH